MRALATAATRAPAAFATWMAKVPIPPPAPFSKTRRPSPTRASRRAWSADIAAAGTAAASSKERRAGLGSSSSSPAIASSAWAPGRAIVPKTASPGRSRATPGPTASTSPARSKPRTNGGFTRKINRNVPSRSLQSMGFIAAAFTRTRTSPRPGAGSGRSRTTMRSMPPKASVTAALMSLSSCPRRSTGTSSTLPVVCRPSRARWASAASARGYVRSMRTSSRPAAPRRARRPPAPRGSPGRRCSARGSAASGRGSPLRARTERVDRRHERRSTCPKNTIIPRGRGSRGSSRRSSSPRSRRRRRRRGLR